MYYTSQLNTKLMTSPGLLSNQNTYIQPANGQFLLAIEFDEQSGIQDGVGKNFHI